MVNSENIVQSNVFILNAEMAANKTYGIYIFGGYAEDSCKESYVLNARSRKMKKIIGIAE